MMTSKRKQKQDLILTRLLNASDAIYVNTQRYATLSKNQKFALAHLLLDGYRQVLQSTLDKESDLEYEKTQRKSERAYQIRTERDRRAFEIRAENAKHKAAFSGYTIR